MFTHPLPVVGAAMPVSALPQHAQWLIEGQRDLEIQDPCHPDVLDGDWQQMVDEARAALDGYSGRLGIHGPFMSLTLMGRDPKIREAVYGRLMTGLEIAEALGATHMVVHSPFEFFGTPFLPHSPGHGQAEQIELVHATLDPVVKQAEQIDCTLVIENIHDQHPTPVQTLVRSFHSQHVQRSIDVGHAFITHLRGGPTPDQWVREDRELLGHLHLQDTDGQVDRHWRPGLGQMNWYALFEALATLEQQPRLILEIRDKSEILAGAAYLAELGLVQ